MSLTDSGLSSSYDPSVSREPEPECDPKSINIDERDETAPTSYVCLGYTFSIIAGFCFTFW